MSAVADLGLDDKVVNLAAHREKLDLPPPGWRKAVEAIRALAEPRRPIEEDR